MKAFYFLLTRLMGLFLLNFSRKAKKSIQKNTEAVYSLRRGTHFSNLFSNQVLTSHMQVFFETIWIIIFKGKFRIANDEEFKKDLKGVMSTGNGLVVGAAHHGSWELLARQISIETNTPFHVLAKATGVKVFDKFVAWFRLCSNCPVLWNHRKSVVRDVMSVLKTGGSVGFVMDQRPQDDAGVLVDFLGMSADFVTGPAKFSAKCGSPLLVASFVRTQFLTYKIEYTFLDAPQTSESQDIQEKTCEMARFLESSIRLYPEQWCWEYRRWKSSVIDPKLSRL